MYSAASSANSNVGAGPPMGPGAGGVYSRYVPYDAHTNSAAPAPAYPAPAAAGGTVSSSSSMFSMGGRHNSGLPTHAPPPPQQQQQNRIFSLHPPTAQPAHNAYPAAATANAGSGSATVTPGSNPSPSASATAAPGSQRLLGNKTLLGGGDDLFQQAPAARPISGSGSGANDGDNIITANSSSSAVL